MKNVNELATKQQERKMKSGATSEHSKTAKAQAVSSVTETAKLTADLQQLKTQLAEIVHEAKTSPRGNMPPRFASRSRQWTRSRWQGGHGGPPSLSSSCRLPKVSIKWHIRTVCPLLSMRGAWTLSFTLSCNESGKPGSVIPGGRG